MKLSELFENESWARELGAVMDSGNGISTWTISRAKEFLGEEEMKTIILKGLLGWVKKQAGRSVFSDRTPRTIVNRYISQLRENGIDYPEFKAIEKSINAK